MSALDDLIDVHKEECTLIHSGLTCVIGTLARAELSALRARVERYTFASVEADTDPRHIFDDTGRCIRCGEDAEEWDSECVEGWTHRLERERDEARARVEQTEKVIALNKYVTPPFDLTDDATVQLALKCVELERERDELKRSLAHYSHCYQGEHAHGCKYGDDTCPMKDIAERVIASATLTPRRCGTCCTEAAEAMREAAATRAEELQRPYTAMEIRALPLQFCDGNPLKPEAAPLTE